MKERKEGRGVRRTGHKMKERKTKGKCKCEFKEVCQKRGKEGRQYEVGKGGLKKLEYNEV